MNFHVVVMFLCTAILVQVRELTTSSNAFDYDDGGIDGERDRVALLAFKSSIKYDPQGVLSSWNSSNHFCEWEGVTCGSGHRRVAILDLSSRDLVGTLSPYIGNLSFVREMSFFNNTLQGKLPSEIGRLVRLAFLDLSFNSHEGEIPANLFRCSNLVNLSLSNNKFVGNVPYELGSLSKLKLLKISFNNFTGGIPHSIGNLSSLELLDGSNNKFKGTIPDIFHGLSQLTVLFLGKNEYINGTIPPSFYNLSRLTNLSLYETQLHGNLPQNFGLIFPKLRYLHLLNCHFTGAIPSSLSNATKLEYIEIDNNKFSGKISIHFGDMKFLSNFGATNNTLGTGRPGDLDFLTSLLNCSYLDYVNIQMNSFGGTLPYSIRNISTSIVYFIISSNQIYGHIPSWIGTLTNLERLAMHANQFLGRIPESLGQLPKLNLLYLYRNKLSGHIPTTLGNLTSMVSLSLHENKLNGTMPPSLGKCQKIKFLYVSQNRLSGNIPKEIFEISALSHVDMSMNRFTGFLPLNVGGLKQLTALVLFDNELSGSIADSLGGCESLQYLIMNNNFFNGSIAQALSSLRGLEAIDLSNNNFSGEIPKYLETLDLIYLNLSFNNFEGEVPTKGIFTNASAISLEGNKRLCGGISELKFPICSIRETKKGDISSLTKILITIFCFILGVILLSSFIYFRLKRKRNVKASESEKTLMKVSYGMLHKATDGFSMANLLGSGSFGSVFKGILNPDEQIIAVKVLNLQRRGASKSFIVECEALRNIRHRNLVKTITACSTVDYQGNDFKALIYEFMPKGNLDMWLHRIPEPTTSENLNLLQRINIAIDIAFAIDYLHHHCHLSVIHCDLKPSNILLDDDMIAHVGDFGIAKILHELSTPNQIGSTGIRGTIGYTPPEYGIGSAVSTRGDIYSFGIVLLEMITGKRPTDGMFEGDLNLHNFARLALSGNVMAIMDPILLSNEAEVETSTNRSVVQANNVEVRNKCVVSMIKIGIACSMEMPQDRMDIVAAVRELHLARDILQPKQQLGRRRR